MILAGQALALCSLVSAGCQVIWRGPSQGFVFDQKALLGLGPGYARVCPLLMWPRGNRTQLKHSNEKPLGLKGKELATGLKGSWALEVISLEPLFVAFWAQGKA